MARKRVENREGSLGYPGVNYGWKPEKGELTMEPENKFHLPSTSRLTIYCIRYKCETTCFFAVHQSLDAPYGIDTGTQNESTLYIRKQFKEVHATSFSGAGYLELYSFICASVLTPRAGRKKARHGGGFKWTTLEKHMRPTNHCLFNTSRLYRIFAPWAAPPVLTSNNDKGLFPRLLKVNKTTPGVATHKSQLKILQDRSQKPRYFLLCTTPFQVQ
ncbi:hypothetical protein TNCV_3933631 [Trichonephila clavipes]|nr:hypothetical protein TNCV_3933631 [Trichonephila clavipes]